MAEINMTKAKEVYRTLLKMLDAKKFKYERHDEDLLIKSGIRGEDLPVEFLMVVMPKNEVVQFISPMPFKIAEDKRVECALAVAVANYGLINGSFDFDLSDGEIRFRLTTSYRDSTLGKDLFEYMMMVGASTVDNYNDKFLMLSKGIITVEQFMEQEKGK